MKALALALVRGEALEEPPSTVGDAAYTFAIQCALGAIGTIDEAAIDEMCGDDYREKI